LIPRIVEFDHNLAESRATEESQSAEPQEPEFVIPRSLFGSIVSGDPRLKSF